MPTSPTAVTAATWLGTWSRPADGPSRVALGIAGLLFAVALVPGGPKWLASTLELASLADLTRRRRFLTVTSFVAAFLSLGYVAFYLRGGPRAAEAAAYWLQGRALAHGELAWTAPEPSASFRARFLLSADPERLVGIFPPGFALLLAPTFWVGAPMLVGPLLAAALVLATWFLGHEIAADGGATRTRAEAVARIAAAFSTGSAALRYHTADVLPYAASAAAIAAAFAVALRARRTGEVRLFGAAGLLVGLVAAIQPPAAVTLGALIFVLAAIHGAGASRALAWSCAAALPGVMFLLAANHAATGRAFGWPTVAYFTSVEPHAAWKARDAARAALLGVRMHWLDIANLEPLALLALVPVLARPRPRAVTWAALVVVGHAVVCALAAAAGVVQGVDAAGAPLLIGVLPIEHVLLALGLARLFPRALAAGATGALALALAGFAVHASREHANLGQSGYGRPHFEPDVAREASVTHGLLFFDDDEGYELASDPGIVASHGIEAVRLRGDDHDRLLYDSLGHPAVHKYAASATGATVQFWIPASTTGDVWRFEAESDWPPVAQTGGWTEVNTPSNPCASDGRVLVLSPKGAADATATIALPVPHGTTPAEPRSWNVVPRVSQRGGPGNATLTLVADLGGPPLAEWTWSDAASGPMCSELPGRAVELGGERKKAWLIMRARGGPVALDKTTLRPR
jgi:hypothetical protein